MNPSIREQIDACRPGRGDLALPELAELAAAVVHDRAVADELERSQRFDQAAQAALIDLDVPAGLMERLLAATAANMPAPALPADELANPSRWTRRRLLTIAGSLAAVLLLAASAFLFLPRRPHVVTQEELGQAAILWAYDTKVNWQPGNTLSAGFEIPRVVTIAKANRWRPLQFSGNRWAASGVAMHLNPPTLPPAMLFVFASSAEFELSPNPRPLTFSGFGGSMKAIAWQAPSTNLIYVLLVEEEGAQRLENFYRPRTEA